MKEYKNESNLDVFLREISHTLQIFRRDYLITKR